MQELAELGQTGTRANLVQREDGQYQFPGFPESAENVQKTREGEGAQGKLRVQPLRVVFRLLGQAGAVP